MTREEQIKNAALKECSSFDLPDKEGKFKGVNSSYGLGFCEGAIWADKTMLDHACEWLKENIDWYSYNAFNTKSGYTEITLNDEFETAFRQAMKGEL